MADPGGDEAGRLEAALERIARATPVLHAAPASQAAPQQTPDTRQIAERLDALIAELRDILAQ